MWCFNNKEKLIQKNASSVACRGPATAVGVRVGTENTAEAEEEEEEEEAADEAAMAGAVGDSNNFADRLSSATNTSPTVMPFNT